MFGLEGLGTPSAELRRMYVDKAFRGSGLARAMLEHAEQTCRDAGTPVLTLSTSELQQAALAFYRKSGYRLVREETAAAQTNKTVGGDIRRYYFEKSCALEPRCIDRAADSYDPVRPALHLFELGCVHAHHATEMRCHPC